MSLWGTPNSWLTQSWDVGFSVSTGSLFSVSHATISLGKQIGVGCKSQDLQGERSLDIAEERVAGEGGQVCIEKTTLFNSLP